MNITKTKNTVNSGIVKCLGPSCNKTFFSENKTYIRFCKQCRQKVEKIGQTLSFRETYRYVVSEE